MLTINFFSSSVEIFESVAKHMVFVYDKPQIKEHASADICTASI